MSTKKARKTPPASICMPKTPVPGMGYFVVCQDQENNMFALWERDTKAK